MQTSAFNGLTFSQGGAKPQCPATRTCIISTPQSRYRDLTSVWLATRRQRPLTGFYIESFHVCLLILFIETVALLRRSTADKIKTLVCLSNDAPPACTQRTAKMFSSSVGLELRRQQQRGTIICLQS